LVGFTAQMLDVLPRSDQRAKGELYVRGLLTDGARKSMQPMAQRLGVDHQRLQQFITSSTWDYERVRANVARWAVPAIDPAAWVVDDTGFPKDGIASPCVARQYSGTLGKTANCQIGVSVQLVTDTASLAANWRLFCPASWDDTAAEDAARAQAARDKRVRAGIPDEVRHREKWRLALDMIDQMRDDWQLPRRPVVADSGYGDCTLFRLGLCGRGLSYVLQVDPTATAQPATLYRSPPPTPVGAARPSRPTPIRRSPSKTSPWPPDAPTSGRSPGGAAPAPPPATGRPRCARTSWPSASARPTAGARRPAIGLP
jgi:SRSO17 transposase